MEHRILPRALTPAVRRALEVFPVVVVVGPRQVGKSTLVRDTALGGDRLYLTLDEIDLLDQARSAPDDFLARAGKITVDEIQRAPELLLAMKREVDRRRRPGRFLVTGSADIRGLREVADRLPGRAVYLDLEPMSSAELRGTPDDRRLEQLLSARDAFGARERLAAQAVRPGDLDALVRRGGLPVPALMEDDEARDLWFASYVRNWLERDVTELARIEDAPDLRRVLLATAARTGALLNQAEVARDASTARTTAHRYLALFAIGRLLDLLPAYSRNLSVRVIKAPRVFWRDAALAAHLVGGRARRKLRELPHWGCLLENLVLANLRAWASTRGSAVELYYWRTAGGREVDFVVEIEDRTIPIEIKATVRPTTADSRHLQEFVSTYRRRCPYGVLLHGGDSIETPVPGVVAAPILSVL